MNNSAHKYKFLFKKKTNKHRNRKVIYDGHKFDSLKEKERYIQLQLLLKAGEIRGFRHHVIFELIPKNKHFRAVNYESDFVVWDKYGNQIVEDCKAKVTNWHKKNYHYSGLTKDYIIKKKLMFHIHNILIKEI